ncbi:MAG TPA: hypothetical protein VMG12_35340, partial [Polyangiaceae bacterium]|nr:hypothetical protein [Polyangiaceae bacterium]
AVLRLTIALAYNLPFQALGALSVEQVRFASIGTAAFAAPGELSLGTLATRAVVGDTLSLDASAAVQADAADGVNQYRLRFERDNVDDGAPNVVVFDLADTQLSVTYLVP